MKNLIYLFVSCIFLITACNRTVDDLLKDKEYANDTLGITGSKRNVLFVVVDGGMGSIIKSLAPRTIMGLTENSIYSWDALSSYSNADTTISGGWANLMTGVLSSKHKVLMENMQNNNLLLYPSFISRIKQIDTSVYLSASYSSSNFGMLTSAANTSSFVSGDQDVTNSVVKQIKQASSGRKNVLVAEYSELANIGMTSGYTITNQAYVAGVARLDAYISSLLQALHERSSYTSENWLVVISSGFNKGAVSSPTNTDNTAFGDPSRNSFVIINNKNFLLDYVAKPASTIGISPYQGKTVRLMGRDASAVRVRVPDPNKIYEGSRGKNITVEFKAKLNRKSNGSFSYTWPPFLSKVASNAGTTPGWCFYRNDHNVAFYVSTNSKKIEPATTNVDDDLWHTYAGEIVWTGSNSYLAKMYLDGSLIAQKASSALTSTEDVYSTSSNLIMGYQPYVANDPIDIYMTDVRIWNTAIPDDVIAKYSCNIDIPSSHPYLSTLIGYWSLRDGSGSTAVDQSSYAQNGIIEGNYQWNSFSDYSNSICPPPTDAYYRGTINIVDVPLQVYQWLNINISSSWRLDSKFWTTTYENVQ